MECGKICTDSLCPNFSKGGGFEYILYSLLYSGLDIWFNTSVSLVVLIYFILFWSF